MIKYILTISFIILGFGSKAQNWTIKINITSDQYLVSNIVDFDLLVSGGNPADDNWEKLKKNPVKEIFGVLKTTFDGLPQVSFQTNNGYVVHSSLSSNQWYFDRDSVMQYNHGVLNLKVAYNRKDTIVFDSIQIVLPRISKIEPYFGDKRNDYFNNIFESGLRIHFEDGRTQNVSPYFYRDQSEFIKTGILNDIIVTGDVYFKDGKYKVNYDNPQNTKQLTFVNRKTNKTINTVIVPKSIYIQIISIGNQPIQVKVEKINGKDGKIYRIDSITKQSFFQIDEEGNKIDSPTIYKLREIDLASINGDNGSDGVDGVKGKPMFVKVDRANKIDSIAKVTVKVDDTSYVCYVDIINGGMLSVFSRGSNGTNGANGGKCGYIENTDSVLFWGMAGDGGKGGNGGMGGEVTVHAHKIYKEFIDNIEIRNEGGMNGRGGVHALQITHVFAPNAGHYYTVEPALIMSGKFRVYYTDPFIAYAPPKRIIMKMPKINKPYIHGEPGKIGPINYNYY